MGDDSDDDQTDSPTETQRLQAPLETDTETATADGDADTATTTEAAEVPEFVEGAEYTFPILYDESITLPEWTWDKMQIRSEVGAGIPTPLYMFMLEDFGARDLTSGGVHRFGIQDWEISDTEITVHLRDDLYWSDGEEILGADFAMGEKISTMMSYSQEQLEAQFGGPRSVGEAVTDVTWDGKSWTYHSEGGGFGDFYAEAFVTGDGFGLMKAEGAKEMNEDRFVYEPLLEQIQDLDNIRPEQENAEQAANLIDEYFDNREEEVSQNPQDQRFSGPWVLDEITQQYVTLAPNEHHRNAPNLPTLRFEPAGQDQQLWSMLTEDIADGALFQGNQPPADVIRSFPDHYQEHVIPGRGGRAEGLIIQPRDPLFGEPVFRHGMARAVNNERLARVVHEITSRAIPRPQGAHWVGAQQWLSEDLIEAMDYYEYDPDRAEEEFREVGMTKEGGQWLRPDGDELTINFITSSDTVQYESSVAAMYDDVGIDVQIRRMDGATVEDRLHNGRYEMASDGWWAPHDPSFWYRALEQGHRRNKFGVFNEEEVQTWIEEHDNIENVDHDWVHVIENYTIEQTKQFTLSAPPVGEPDAEPTVEYPIVYEDLLLQRNISEERRREIIQRSNWVWNYRLPVLQFHMDFNLVVQDHDKYQAPESDEEWALYWSSPKMWWRGAIKALEAAGE